eukprot:1154758-Pelagomonas_calceolata.AAC.1
MPSFCKWSNNTGGGSHTAHTRTHTQASHLSPEPGERAGLQRPCCRHCGASCPICRIAQKVCNSTTWGSEGDMRMRHAGSLSKKTDRQCLQKRCSPQDSSDGDTGLSGCCVENEEGKKLPEPHLGTTSTSCSPESLHQRFQMNEEAD